MKSALWTRRIDAPGSIFDFARRASAGASAFVGEAPTTFPLRYDVRIEVPSTLRVDTNLLRLVASADLTLQGSSRLNPTARLTIGKRISDRVYLTFSRSLGTTINDQIVLLEYDESDRVSWILSRNEDSQSYALEFRVRHVF